MADFNSHISRQLTKWIRMQTVIIDILGLNWPLDRCDRIIRGQMLTPGVMRPSFCSSSSLFFSLSPSAGLWCGGVRQSVVCCCWGVSTTSLSVSFLFAPLSYITCLWWCWAQCSNFSASCNWNRCSYKLEKVPVSLVSEALNRSVLSNFNSQGITENIWTHCTFMIIRYF